MTQNSITRTAAPEKSAPHLAANDDATRVVDEGARRRFEEAWAQGQPQPLESCLPSEDDPCYSATLEELVLIEMEFRWKAKLPEGEKKPNPPPPVEEYLGRFSRLQRPDVVLALVRHEFQLRLQCGAAPTMAEYQARFPDLTFPAEDWGLTPNRAATRGEPTLRIPGYNVLEVIGRGGMGVVHKAVQEGLGRFVALKQVLSGTFATAQELARFETEAHALAQVRHPNIVQVFDVGEAEGRRFLALEYVEGGTLAQRLGGSPMPGRAAAEMIAMLARALAAVHERGILHRDLKPSNVLLTADGQPKITDFGLAKRVQGADGGAAQSLTSTGAVVGTPSYMAPEQAAGKSKEVGPAADIYALGAILYEMLTGRPPFKGETPMDTVLQVMAHEPVPPRQMQPRLARDLETICLKCLEKEPARRYPTALALAEDLDRFLADEPIQARAVTAPERAVRWCRRHPLLASLWAAAGILLAGVVVGLFLWQRAEFERREQVARLQSQKQQDDLRRREKLRGAALHNRELAHSEIRAGRFASAEKFLATALDNARGEDLADLAAPIALEHERISRLVDFQRLADKAERLAFLDSDHGALSACATSLRRLGVLGVKDSWWTRLPVADLQPDQAAKLRREAAHQLTLLAALRIKQAGEGTGSKKPGGAVYQEALQVLDQVQQYHEAHKLGPSLAARILQTHCHVSLLELGKIKSLRGLEPASASDCYYVGIAHMWLANSPNDWISTALTATCRLLGLDLGEPAPAARRLLLRAAADESSHYWSHFWLGWALVAARDPAGAELAFTTCVTLRPDDGPGYAERARALALQFAASKDEHARKELQRRCRADGERALQNAPHDWYVHSTLLYAYALLGWKKETMQAAGRMLEVLPSPRLLGSRPRAEQAHLLKEVADYFDKLAQTDPAETEPSSILALTHLFLGNEEEAARLAERVLKANADDARARLVRGALALRRQQPSAASADFEAILARQPKYLRALHGLARVAELEKKWEEAARRYQELVPLAVTDWQRLQVHLGAARALTQVGKQAEARQALLLAQEFDPEATLEPNSKTK